MRHNCVFVGMVLINTAVYTNFGEEHALYSEQVEMPDIVLKIVVYYEFFRQESGVTRLNFNVNWLGRELPAENKQAMMASQARNLENFNILCENELT